MSKKHYKNVVQAVRVGEWAVRVRDVKVEWVVSVGCALNKDKKKVMWANGLVREPAGLACLACELNGTG